MKSLINKGIHKLLRLAHTPAPCSDEERIAYLNQANEVNGKIKDWLGDEVVEIIGLGQNCNASWYIKASGNKKSSYPFDWIFTTPEIILDMLADDFGSFTEKEMLIPHGMDAGHKRYHETLFGHRNPASKESDRQYLLRCLERWRTKMKTQHPVLFLTIVLNESDKRKRWKKGFTKDFAMPTEQTIEDFYPLMDRLLALNPNAKFLFIEQHTEGNFHLSIETQTSKARWLNFTSIDKNTGVQYIHEVDDDVMKTLLTGLSENAGI